MKHSTTPHPSFLSFALAGLGLSLLAAPGLLMGPRLEAQTGEPQQRKQLGTTLVEADELEYDLETHLYELKGDVKVTSPDSRMTGDQMTVKVNKKNQLEWVKAEGKVFLEKRNQEEGTFMTGRGKEGFYNETEQKAHLTGGVIVHQSSPRLLKPAVVTGSRVDMDLKTNVNVVTRTEGEQAKVHVEPKGKTPKPAAPGKEPAPAAPATAPAKPETAGPAKPEATEPPEPVDLIGDRIQMNSETQEYEATGNPVMVRPSSKLRAKKIRFQVDEAEGEIKVAYAEENVIFDGQNEKGSVIHATGDNGTFTQETNELVLTGQVHATVKDPEAEEPQVYQGGKFIFNNKTGRRKLFRSTDRQATGVIPKSAQPKKAAPAEGEQKPGTAPAEGEKPKPEQEKK